MGRKGLIAVAGGTVAFGLGRERGADRAGLERVGRIGGHAKQEWGPWGSAGEASP
jgi:hypothetical protein